MEPNKVKVTDEEVGEDTSSDEESSDESDDDEVSEAKIISSIKYNVFLLAKWPMIRQRQVIRLVSFYIHATLFSILDGVLGSFFEVSLLSSQQKVVIL